MSLPLLTAVTPRWEGDLTRRLGASESTHVVRRCADLAELLGSAAAGIARVAVVSSDLRGMDKAAVRELLERDLFVLGVHPPGDEAGERALRRWGVAAVLPADADQTQLERALADLTSGGPGGSGQGGTGRGSSGRGSSGRGSSGRGSSGRGSSGRGSSGQGSSGQGDSGDTAPETPCGSGDGDSRGASDPADPADTAAHFDDLPPGRAHPGRVIVVWGPVGSPGRTTVAVNLAAELAGPPHSVLLVDLDTYGASVAQALAVLDEAPGVAAAARAADHGTLDGASLGALAPQVAPGLRVLTGMPRADRWPELREPAVRDVLAQCTELARWTVVDVGFSLEADEELSFDTTAPRRNGATLAALDVADEVIVVGTGDPVGLQRLVRGLDEVRGHTTAPCTVAITRVRPGAVGSHPERRVREALERFAGVTEPVLIAEDQAGVDAALLHGRTLAEARSNSPARAGMQELAGRLRDAGGPPSEREPGDHRPTRRRRRRRRRGRAAAGA